MLSPKKGRHRAPRQPVNTSALAVPVVLLAAGGGAFAGLASAPATAGPPAFRIATASAVALPAPVPLPRTTYDKDLDALDASAARTQQAQVAQQRARAAAAERASRSRRVALQTQARARAAEAAEAAAAAAAKAEAEREERLRRQYVRPSNGGLTSTYGPRWGRLHAGLDFGAATGSPIRAVASGEVVSAGYDSGYGNFVHVQHDDGTLTTYNHMSQVMRRGGSVDPGDVLGLVGSTGHSTGPHLHFEVRVGGSPVDPLPWLRRNGVSL